MTFALPRRGAAQLLALLAVVGLPLAIVGTALLLVSGGHARRPPPRLRAAGEVDVSSRRGIQSETAIATDPRHPRVLVAGSNDVTRRRMRVYSSTDGGRDWHRQLLPQPPGAGLCDASDPSVAIDDRGRQYYSFLGLKCSGRRIRSSSVYLAWRAGPAARWRTLRLPVARRRLFTLGDDRPMVAVDTSAGSPHRGRVYIAWTRFAIDPDSLFVISDEGDANIVQASARVAYSDNGGRRWSAPTRMSVHGYPLEVRLAIGADGTVYATWRASKTNSIFIARSRDGRHFGSAQLVAASVVPPERSCGGFRSRIPAQPRRCVSPNPVIAVDRSHGRYRGRVYVVYGTTALNQSQDVGVTAYDAQLHPLLGARTVQQVNPPERFRGRDQFLPTAAVDERTGRLWACYYATLRPAGRLARYTCTASDDGGAHWHTPTPLARVASDETRRPANRANGYGDYEGVTAAAGVAHAIWTDGRFLRTRREEIFTARVH